jgi:hypothetical protein
MSEGSGAALTAHMLECLELMRSFIRGNMPLPQLYDAVDLFEERERNLDPSTLDARVLAPIAASLGGICIMSRAGEPREDVIDYLRQLIRELEDPEWRARVAAGWWPYGNDE